MDEYQDRDGTIFYHPYWRQCFPLTWMNIKTGMELYFIIHTGVSAFHWHWWISRQGWNYIFSFIRASVLSINSYEYQDTDESLFYHPYGRQSSAPYFSISWILGNMKTDDVISSIQTRETDEGMSIKKRWKYSLSSMWMSVFSPLFFHEQH
jgi:hypothetical protein